MHARTTFAGAALLAALVLATAGPSGRGGETYRTPQDVFKAAQEAVKKKDNKALMNCLTEDTKDVLAGGAAFGAVMIKTFAMAFAKGEDAKKVLEKLKDLDAVLSRHGLTEEALAKMKGEMPADGGKDPEAMKKALKAIIRPIKDKGAFLGELIAALDKLGNKKDDGALAADGQLKDVKIDGDKAVGVVVRTVGGQENREDMHFRKAGGGWKIEITLDQVMKKGGPPVK